MEELKLSMLRKKAIISRQIWKKSFELPRVVELGENVELTPSVASLASFFHNKPIVDTLSAITIGFITDKLSQHIFQLAQLYFSGAKTELVNNVQNRIKRKVSEKLNSFVNLIAYKLKRLFCKIIGLRY